jgi:hypothetical protein
MYNYYIDENSYSNVGINKFTYNLVELTKVLNSAYKEELFYKNDALLWSVIIDGTNNFIQCLNSHKFNKIGGIHGIFKRINNYANSFVNMTNTHVNEFNALWGVLYTQQQSNNLTNFLEYDNFRRKSATNKITPLNFKQYEKFVFKKIRFCDNAYNQISQLNVNIFETFLPDLLKLDDYNLKWVTGSCTPNLIRNSVGINISNESDSVNNDPKLRKLRYFKLPNGHSEYFEMHIKKGDQRMHIFPDNNQKIIYIGYIGNHLPTSKFK